MTDIEIPLVPDRNRRYRFFEMLPGLLSWSILALPFILTLINPLLAVIFVIDYLLIWFVKALALDVRAVQGYRYLTLHQKLPWNDMLRDLDNQQAQAAAPKWHATNVARLATRQGVVKSGDVIHAVIIATWNESREVLEPTIQAVIDSHYDTQKMILMIAYEQRGGPEVQARAEQLIQDYKGKFKYAVANKHIDQPGEIIGKGGNITAAGRNLQKYLAEQKIDPAKVIVTTLDSDNRPHPYYFSSVSYLYCLTEEPKYVSYQPIPMYTNNIWDAPAPMRVIATGNSFWMTIQGLRTHMLRNFSAHAQTMDALIDTDFWSVRTVVEDGHQFWRTYFRFEGKHQVYPVFLPIYQDAVLSTNYLKTLKAQFIQIRRWAWGASDVAFVAEKGFFSKNKVPKRDLLFKFLRLLEGHVTWAVAPLILAFSAFVPILLNPNSFAANQLPVIVSRIQTVALAGIFVTLFFSWKTLPPKPKRYKAHRSFFMVIQWVYLPFTTIAFSSFAAINSQTRLIFGRYLGKFDLTDKAVVTEGNKKKL